MTGGYCFIRCLRLESHISLPIAVQHLVLASLFLCSLVKRSLGVAGKRALLLVRLLLSVLERLGSTLLVWLGGLTLLTMRLSLWLGGLATLVWCRHF